ncbi:hypothetical protein QSJ18_05300 [Gordonia sp. ABSL1-1]|uniref:hypothetical protein n=1 Tax=Gordonia sp. ABSL1-1 TaxID=3053923 RepID=UPI00257330A7|nr:hypothetical protein [Gordonia sp. ABSL1-1]MDL9936150.1 hypothetical protein [Gordonia sp. ABSL1-1]
MHPAAAGPGDPRRPAAVVSGHTVVSGHAVVSGHTVVSGHPPRFTTLAVALVIAIITAVTVAADRPDLATPSIEVVATTELRCLDDALTAYADTGTGWTGGDSTWSVALPGGVDLFAFSDTFLSPISPPTRPSDAVFVHNSFVLRDPDGTLRTITGGTAEHPESLISPADPAHWYWLGAATLLDGTLVVPLTEWRATGDGPLDFGFVGSATAHFDPADLTRPTSVVPLPRSRGIQWGQWILPDAGYTYVYGAETAGDTKYLHVARVAGTDIGSGLRFWDGRVWSADEVRSTRLAEGIYSEFSVTRLGAAGYLLTTMRGGAGLTDELVGRMGATPTGPFGPPVTVFTTPETGRAGTYRDADVYTYNAHVHPAFSTADRLVISYNVNSLDSRVGGDLYRDVSIYRPRFLAVDLNPTGDAASRPGEMPARPACPAQPGPPSPAGSVGPGA